MAERREIVAAGDVRAFFHEQLTGALARQRLALESHTEFYLVNLLAEYMHSGQLFDESEGAGHEPLALILARAMEQPPAERAKTLRRLGDMSLYVSGFFSDSLARRVVDLDYYINMGGQAYSGAAELASQTSRTRPLSPALQELAQRFSEVVDCLMEVSERTGPTRSADLVRTYERWLHTRSDRLARRLSRAGVLVAAPAKGDVVH